MTYVERETELKVLKKFYILRTYCEMCYYNWNLWAELN